MNNGYHSSKSKKIISVKPFNRPPAVVADYFDTCWPALSDFVTSVFNSRPSNVSKVDLSRIVSDLCQQGMSSRLYGCLTALTDSCMSNLPQNISSSEISDMDSYLSHLYSLWSSHYQVIMLISDVFVNLTANHAMVKPIKEHCYACFRCHIQHGNIIIVKVIQGLLQIFDDDRRGFCSPVSRELGRNIISMLYRLMLIKDCFSIPFLASSLSFFKSLVIDLISTASSDEYTSQVNYRIIQAETMMKYYMLDDDIQRSVLKMIDTEMIISQLQILLSKGLWGFISDDKHDCIQAIYRLVRRVGHVDALVTSYGDWIVNRVTTVLTSSSSSSSSQEIDVIDDVMMIYDKCMKVVSAGFHGDDVFVERTRLSLEVGLNDGNKASQISEYLARWMHAKLQTNTDISPVMDMFMLIFKLTSTKDVFEAFYRKLLSKRLLVAYNDEYERNIITGMKAECGPSFTSKMEGMLKDIDGSKFVNDNWNDDDGGGVDAYYNILTTGFWPSYASLPVNLPLIISSSCASFENHYNNKYSGRRLTWCLGLCRCLVVGHLSTGRKEFDVSLYQSIVLLLFNHVTSIKTQQIIELTLLTEAEAKLTLMSLACGPLPVRVLSKSPKSKEIGLDDEFAVNSKFVNKSNRIKIASIQMKEKEIDSDATYQQVFHERQYLVDACIVRIMKARKTIDHSQLIADVMGQLKFNVKVGDIKKRVESLIEREYLVRDKVDSSMYLYVA